MSARAEGRDDAFRASAYTGFAYLVTVALLILPYLFAGKEGYIGALAVTMAAAIVIIAAFNIYASVILDRPFKKNFFEMICLSLGVSAISFVVGIVVKQFLKIEL
jgi:VIT1/CCC1 family predicted Fe2+/Mn2+ transporter